MIIKELFLKSVMLNNLSFIYTKLFFLKKVDMNYRRILILCFLMGGFAINAAAQDLVKGKQLYETRCLVCHQADGGGVPNMNAPLDGASNVVGNDITRLVRIIKYGFNERVELDGLYYSNSMTPNPDLTPAQISDVLSYIRSSWSNKATKVTIAQVQQGIKGSQKTSTK
jgi:mono/diheme cytochrome c family protein